jgi:CBS domain-containing protein
MLPIATALIAQPSRAETGALRRSRTDCAIDDRIPGSWLARGLLDRCREEAAMEPDMLRCRIYTGGGELESTRSRPIDLPAVPRSPTLADRIAVSAIMTRDVVCARPDLGVGALTTLLIRNHIGCVPIVDDLGRPTGIVTKLDLVERTWPGLIASDVMMPLAITLNEHATIAHAAAMMSLEDVHHLMVVGSDHALVGVISTMDIVRWLARNDGFLSD